MAKMDSYHNNLAEIALSNKIYADGMDQNGANIDMQGYESVMFVIQAGVLATAGDTDGTYAFVLQEGDATDDYATVTDTNIILGTVPTIDGTEADERDKVYQFGYVGDKRYVRLQFDASAITNGMPLGAVAYKGNPHSAPTQ